MLPIKADHPERAGFAAAFEERGRLQILGTLVRALRRHPGTDVVSLLEDLIEAEVDGGRVIRLLPGVLPAGAPMAISGGERGLRHPPRQEGAQRGLKSISESRPLSAEEIVEACLAGWRGASRH
jgi:hypothetical protein